MLGGLGIGQLFFVLGTWRCCGYLARSRRAAAAMVRGRRQRRYYFAAAMHSLNLIKGFCLV
jgi:hypothetical protein